MEQITYRITLDTHRNGIQRTLQGFETADNMSRRIAVNLVAGSDTFEIPLDHVVAVMYVTPPDTTEPSVNECTIENNTVIYDVLPADIAVEGITEMQLKLIAGDTVGAKSVLVAPKFALEVSQSNASDDGAEQGATFTALENAIISSKAVYNSRLVRVEVDSECMFRAFYADGTIYESDTLYQIVHSAGYALSKSYAEGGTGVREGEDTDNSKYYAGIAKSASAGMNEIVKQSQALLDEVTEQAVYAVFKVDFETGLLEYNSSSYTFNIDDATGELIATTGKDPNVNIVYADGNYYAQYGDDVSTRKLLA